MNVWGVWVCRECKSAGNGRILRALDLFCGGGAVAEGLLAAGFNEVVGVDIVDHRKNYPGRFVQGDALDLELDLNEFDFIWASPPCQAYSVATPVEARAHHPDLIDDVRTMLQSHRFTCIENVMRAPLRADIVLTGPTVGLPRIERARKFEVSWPAETPELVRVERHCPPLPIVHNLTWQSESIKRLRRRFPGAKHSIRSDTAHKAMGLQHRMTVKELGEAVPPAYSRYIGEQAIPKILVQQK